MQILRALESKLSIAALVLPASGEKRGGGVLLTPVEAVERGFMTFPLGSLAGKTM